MISLALRMLLVVWPVSVPAARDHRENVEALDSMMQQELKGMHENPCDAVTQKLKRLHEALTDISEAHAHLSVLLEANWARFFGGSLHDDISSAMKVNASLVAQRRTMRELMDAGLGHQASLSAYLRACQGSSLLAADVHRHDTPGHRDSTDGTEKPRDRQRRVQLHQPWRHRRLEPKGHIK
mmetsp:Transcript_26912/g.52750  ORF Transcript_26912/g.52750 Transcript_26912/m.52750 type:complete len:182 (-) Transcript_26912:7-552(-)